MTEVKDSTNMAHCRQHAVSMCCAASTHLAVTCTKHVRTHTHPAMSCKVGPWSLFPRLPAELPFFFHFCSSHLVRINSFFPFSSAERRGERISPAVEEGKFFSFRTHRASLWGGDGARATCCSFRT